MRGRVRRTDGNQVVVSLGVVDVSALVPASTAARLTPGADVELHTHLAVRPDHVALYGFDTPAALTAFELLITVNGVGPKGALGLLSALSVEDLHSAIIEGDARALARAPGIGPRVASRIVAELREKFLGLPVAVPGGHGAEISAALDALVALGYSLTDARRAVQIQPADGSAEDMVRAALHYLDARTR